MKVDEIKKHFKNESEQMEKYRLASIHAQLEFEDAEDNHDPDLYKYKNAMENAEKEEDSFAEIYANAIFDFLKDKNLILIRNQNNQKIAWNDAFGTDFSILSIELKGSLIALIDEDGGQYRLA